MCSLGRILFLVQTDLFERWDDNGLELEREEEEKGDGRSRGRPGVLAMTSQSRFHFLNLWDETPEEEEKEGRVREHQSANRDASQRRSNLTWGSGKSCLYLCGV